MNSKRLQVVRSISEYADVVRLRDGREVIIELDDSVPQVRFYTLEKEAIGRLEFAEEEGPGSNCIFFKWAYLDFLGDSYLHQGLGREGLVRIKEMWGMPIVAQEDDGHRRSNGSHLTGDAPCFIQKMRQEGTIEPTRGSLIEDDDHDNF